MTEPKRTINRIGGLLAIFAIAAGIFYVLYVLYWSGDQIARIELSPQGRSEALAVALEPEMNPVRAILNLEHSGQLGRRIASYDVAIGGDDEAGIKDIFNKDGIANDPSDDTGRTIRVRGHNVNLGTFEVPLDAGYLLRADISPSNQVDIHAASVTLTANSAEWDFRIVGGLAAALILGAVMGAAGRDKKSG